MSFINTMIQLKLDQNSELFTFNNNTKKMKRTIKDWNLLPPPPPPPPDIQRTPNTDTFRLQATNFFRNWDWSNKDLISNIAHPLILFVWFLTERSGVTKDEEEEIN